MFHNIYQGKKVFVTGHTGFKGSWLTLWLTKLGARVCGYALAPTTQPSMHEALHLSQHISQSIVGDILDEKVLQSALKQFQPDIVFHLAAQPLVRLSYKEPILTYRTNVMGTLNVLETARKCDSVKAFVNITTDKCYENKEVTRGYKEEDPMGGYDMYSSSKGCVEIMSASFRRSFLQAPGSMALATARAGNVIGGGDWAEDRLVPDCIRALVNKTPLVIRNPQAIRPWQFVLEPLSGYLLLGQKLLEAGNKYAQSFNFGPVSMPGLTVAQVIKQFIAQYAPGHPIEEVPASLHETNLLLLNTEKASRLLGWEPSYTFEQAIEETARWYHHFYQRDTDMLAFTLAQISAYENAYCNVSIVQ